MTETAAAIAFNPGRGTPMQGSVGFRAPFAEIRIASIKPGAQGATCPPNVSGAVWVKGPQVFPGYLESGHNHGVRSKDGWLITGDVGYLTEEQRLVLTGRQKDLIIRSGHNLNPGDIEDVANVFPGVHITAAVGMPDAYAGEVPILFAVARPDTKLDLAALQRHMDEHVAEPPARPKRVILLDALPTTAVGKIIKSELRDRAVAENVRIEVERIFGPTVVPEIAVENDEKLNTVVRVAIRTGDEAGIKRLREALKPLPQTYAVVAIGGGMPAAPVLLERHGGVAIITFNRPEALNAFSEEMAHALEPILDDLAADETVRAAIVTGAGKAFSAGGDLLQFGALLARDPESLVATFARNQKVIDKIERLPFPVIAAVNGVAVAGGLEVILCCDFVLATEQAKIGDGHAKYAIVPTAGSSVRLFTKIGANRALHMLFCAELFPATELREWGLVNEVVPADRLLVRAREVADQYAQQSPQVLRRMKALARAANESRITNGLRLELEALRQHLTSSDLAEGLAAFKEKRKPVY
jgi:enoyl-CoA hydratase/carnithine racemase